MCEVISFVAGIGFSIGFCCVPHLYGCFFMASFLKRLIRPEVMLTTFAEQRTNSTRVRRKKSLIAALKSQTLSLPPYG